MAIFMLFLPDQFCSLRCIREDIPIAARWEECRRRSAGRNAACRRGAGALGGLAWTRHTAARAGWDGAVSLFADVLHLLAAGFWVAGLVLLLENVRREPANKRHFISAATVPFSSIDTR
jgi:putative copper export protein